ncbi:MAG: hypothetical protein ACON4X_05475 [Polaribacter sp.]
MKKYRNRIIEIFENYPVDVENEKPGIRWAFEPIKNETKYLILGINPSNSVNKVNSVILKSGERWIKGKFKTQKKYDLFLANKENEEQITLLQKLSHEHHPHFKKHKVFLSYLNDIEENNYQFFDLFPVWGIKQKEFLAELDFDEKVKSIEAFIDLIDRHSNLKGLYFFNSGAAEFFMKENKTSWDLPHKRINVRKEKDIKGERISVVKKGNIKLNNRNIDIHCFGIGGYFGPSDLKELANKWNKYLSDEIL